MTVLMVILLTAVWALIFLGLPYCLWRRAANNGQRGCIIGGCAGPLLFFCLVTLSNDAPELGGALVVPLFIAVGGLVGWIAGGFIKNSP